MKRPEFTHGHIFSNNYFLLRLLETQRKNAQRLREEKKEKERKEKEEQKKKEQAEKSRLEAEKKAADLKAKQDAANAARKAEMNAEELAKQNELLSVQFSEQREDALNHVEGKEEAELKTILADKCKDNAPLRGALGHLRSASSKASDEDFEVLVDKALAVMGAHGLVGMTCGIQPPAGIKPIAAVRNRSKKVRQPIRNVGTWALKEDNTLALDASLHEDGENHAAFIISDKCPVLLIGKDAHWNPTAPAAEESAGKNNKKKKKKNKPAAEEEDLDALLQEFGVEVKKGKKKKK